MITWCHMWLFVILYQFVYVPDFNDNLLTIDDQYHMCWYVVTDDDCCTAYSTDILQQSNMAMENGPFISYFPIKTSISKGFSIAMSDYQRLSISAHIVSITTYSWYTYLYLYIDIRICINIYIYIHGYVIHKYIS